MHYIRSKATLIVTFLLASKLFLGCDNINSNNIWTSIEPLPLDPDIEKQIDEILPKLTLEQKVGQVIQGDSDHVTPEDVKKYRLGSVLSGGNSAPGPLPYAETKSWLEMADKYFSASIEDDDVEIAMEADKNVEHVGSAADFLYTKYQ